MKYVLIPALAGTLLLAGCADLMLTTTPPVTVTANQGTIVVKTQVLQGGYRTAADPRLTANHINHIVLSIYELVNGQEVDILDDLGQPVTHDLTRANIGSLITFEKLKPQTTYRIRAAAYQAPGTDPADLISTTDAGSYVDVEVKDDDRPVVTTLKVKLIDVAFDGQATFNGVTVTPGGLAPTGPVTITIAPGDGEDEEEPLLNEGSPAHQSLLDDYLPTFTEGKTWVYRVSRTEGGNTLMATKTVTVTSVSQYTLTVTTTYTLDDDPDNPQVLPNNIIAPQQWYPPATALRELMPYETFDFKGDTVTGVAKHAFADNTASDNVYLWIAHGLGVVKSLVTMPDGEGGSIVEEELLVDIF